MKKTALLVSFLFIGSIFFSSYNTPKEFTFKFSDAQVAGIYAALQQSKAPFTDVAPLLQEIQTQYQAQIVADTTKKK